MATKQIKIRTVGLFLPALFMTALGTLQEIPDGKVFTDIQKTLINGTWGILTCPFSGPPYAVYWKKGHDPFTAPTLMTWTPDGKTGPRYEDGTCDMDENYSLIIKAVDYTYAGRYICLVSNQHGVLIDNFTDVTVTDIAIETKSTLSTQMGQTGVLPCQVNIRPKKVSWIRSPDTALITTDLIRNVIERSGPGYEEGLFNMTKEYSLVIKDVTIFHEGRYLCEAIDFDTHNVYRDVTILTVFAKPADPFPAIEGCPLEDQSYCIITTDSSIILTCHVNQYYPDINLVFMHGSEIVESLTTLTWNNTDGTKNKSVAISADISHDVYKCIASKIPGFDLNDDSFSSVRLIQHVQDQSNLPILAVLIVPIVICLTVVLLAWMRLRKRDQVLYVELWKLVEYITERQEIQELVSLITLLDGNEESLMNGDQEYYYHKLCRWKETRAWTINRRKTLYEKCSQVDLDESVQKLEDFRHKTSIVNIPPSDFEHILWHINEPDKMRKFLVSLGIDMKREAELAQKKEIIEKAVQKLATWNSRKLRFLNPVIIICSTLEMLGHCTADNNFFQIPTEEKDNLNENELQRFIRDITSNHWQKLESIIKSIKGRLKHTDQNENDEVLFDMEKMLRDCLDDMECSNYDKRRKLEPSSYVHSDDSESSGLLQPLRNDPIHKAEYVDIAFDLLMTDILPVAKALDVNVNKLPGYRPVFKASHLQKGTIGLVAELVESVGHSRLDLCNHLREAGFPFAIAKNILVNHGELYTNTNAIREDDCRLEVSGASGDEEEPSEEEQNLLNKDDISSTEMQNFIKEVKEEESGLNDEISSHI